jgi:hypothetical protein
MTSPYLEPPTIPEGMSVHEYRINRPHVRATGIRRLLGLAGVAKTRK